VCFWGRLLGWQRRDATPLSSPGVTYREDYRPPAYRVARVDLHFELDAGTTTVRSRIEFQRDLQVEPGAPLILDGRDLELVSIRLDDAELAAHCYQRHDNRLVITQAPDAGVLEIMTRIHPAANTALEGLYQSGELLCTQCEAQGFSRITYFPDRPDVMTRYRVTLSADRARYPVLLANGNPIASGAGEGGRHWVSWEDPFPKPCYLFALVAGDLALVEDQFITASGRRIALRIYVEPSNHDKCAHAMVSLKQAMRWDEEAYGREYDLDIFMIVAVGSFNMGAMENKGLNIFNAKYIVADPQTATDDDHEAVRDIIGHEYFHNWTGNRITCRDWFQLSVKESLTVFREQQFSAAMGSEAITRVRQARLIRTQQFPEDAGPTAHPVRPDSYMEVNNLYTLTVYEKGAEVIRMIHTLLGPEQFRAGMDLYFARHDGQAVTVEDFLKTMEETAGRDLSQFRLWYSQAGTPVVKVELQPVRDGRQILKLEQFCPATPGQPEKSPLHIPLRLALMGSGGKLHSERIIEMTQATEQFGFDDKGPCTASLLRGFSAPVRIQQDVTDDQLRQLITHAGDGYSRWDAAQQLFLRQLTGRISSLRRVEEAPAVDALAVVIEKLLVHSVNDEALVTELLQMPGENTLVDQLEEVQVDSLVAARDGLRRELAVRLFPQMLSVYERCASTASYRFEATEVARRRLRNVCLTWLVAEGGEAGRKLALSQYHSANNMTDSQAALVALNNHDSPERSEVMAHFHRRWQEQPLVLDKWLTLHATAGLPNSLQIVTALLEDPHFDRANPNRIRALVGAFAHNNLRGFHRVDGSGYAFIANQVQRLDRLNPQVAARLAGAFTRWRRFAAPRRELMRMQLERLRAVTGLSSDVHEIVSKSLTVD
jgi:aminopeptidase N